jgi:acetyl esterase/lipase
MCSKMSLLNAVTLSLVFSCGPIPKPPRADTSWIKNKHLDIAYATQSPAQKLDIYLPDSSSGPLPVIVSIHGGAFMFGDKGDIQVVPMLEGLTRGYAVVSINYRLSGEALFPAQINDVKNAIRWIKKNADTYNLDPNNIAVWGGSAGGHLAALAGTSGGVDFSEQTASEFAGISDSIHAVVDWFGPIHFSEMDPQFQASGKGKADHSAVNSPESKLLGKKLADVPELVAKANPETYISAGAPPFFIQHGTEDPMVPFEQSARFFEKLVPVLGAENVTFIPLEGAKHGGRDFETPENLEKVFAFLDRVLKGRPV